MTYASCAGSLAANIAKDCSKPMTGGYTGRGLLIPLSNTPTYAINATNPRIITSITMGASDKLAVIDNVWPSTFDGSNTQSNADSGRTLYGKTFAFRIPLRGAGDRKSTRLNSSHQISSYAVFCLKKKTDGRQLHGRVLRARRAGGRGHQ